MVVYAQAPSFADLFIEPFYQGYYNLQDAVRGSKIDLVNSIAHEIFRTPLTMKALSLAGRVSAALVGILLIIPLVNAVVFAVLKIIDSELIHPFQPQVRLEPIHLLEVEAITPEAMTARKRVALARLAGIEQMTEPNQEPLAALTQNFEPSVHILRFSLDRMLYRYRTEHTPSKLYDFMDWARIPDDDRRNAFREAINRYDQPLGLGAMLIDLNSQEITVRTLLSHLAEYFSQQQASVPVESPAEQAVKRQFVNVYESLIDADNNCIDQTLSQLQSLVLDVIAEGDAGLADSTQLKIIIRASTALCQYRAVLLKEILARQNPDERHIADLERVAMQRVAELLEVNGGVFVAGARFGDMLRRADEQVATAISTFFDEYKPLEYLLKDLQPNDGTHRELRNGILNWARDYYDWEHEEADDLADGTEAPNMVARVSDEPGRWTSADEGGRLTLPGLAYLMETLGLIYQPAPRAPVGI